MKRDGQARNRVRALFATRVKPVTAKGVAGLADISLTMAYFILHEMTAAGELEQTKSRGGTTWRKMEAA